MEHGRADMKNKPDYRVTCYVIEARCLRVRGTEREEVGHVKLAETEPGTPLPDGWDAGSVEECAIGAMYGLRLSPPSR